MDSTSLNFELCTILKARMTSYENLVKQKKGTLGIKYHAARRLYQRFSNYKNIQLPVLCEKIREEKVFLEILFSPKSKFKNLRNSINQIILYAENYGRTA